jgi:hypothetical protein
MDTEQKMTKGSKIFFLVLALLIIGSIGFTFWRIFIAKDYQIIAEVSCDTMAASCFFWEDEEEAYTYKMISKKASNIYACEQAEEKIDCDEELSCLEDEEDCEYIVCDPAELAEDEICVGPGVEAEIEDEEEIEEMLESEIMDGEEIEESGEEEVIEEEPELI